MLSLPNLRSVLIKPVGADCNLDCDYCFYLDRAGTPRPGWRSHAPRAHERRMEDAVLREVIAQSLEPGAPHVLFVWQGGEPTLAGVDFFWRATELQREHARPGQRITNAIQTNGLLVDPRYCELFSTTSWLVGLSIDGPPHVHDRHRRNRRGTGSYELAMRAARLLREAGVEFNILSVVTDHSARFAREIFEHHRALDVRELHFIPCVERDPKDTARAAPYSVSAKAYGQFLCELFDCWRDSFADGRPSLSIRYFEAVLHGYLGLESSDCTLHEACGDYVVVEHDGQVFSCDFFVEPRFRLGDVRQRRLIDMLRSEQQRAFGELKRQRPDECETCTWLQRCQGGCTKDRLRDPDDHGSNHFCASFKRFFEHAHGDLMSLARSYRRQQRFTARTRPVAPHGRKRLPVL